MLADDASGGHSAGYHRVSGGAGTVQTACRDPLRDASICSMAYAPPDKHHIERLIEALETEFPAEPDSARVEIARAPGRVGLSWKFGLQRFDQSLDSMLVGRG